MTFSKLISGSPGRDERREKGKMRTPKRESSCPLITSPVIRITGKLAVLFTCWYGCRGSNADKTNIDYCVQSVKGEREREEVKKRAREWWLGNEKSSSETETRALLCACVGVVH